MYKLAARRVSQLLSQPGAGAREESIRLYTYLHFNTKITVFRLQGFPSLRLLHQAFILFIIFV